MRTRHRIPNLFSVYMVDVLCCTLGCTLILWLINVNEAKRQTDAAGEANTQLAAAEARIGELEQQSAALQSQLASAQQRADDLARSLQASDSDRKLTAKDLQMARAQLEELDKTLASLREKNDALQTQVTAGMRKQADLLGETKSLEARLSALNLQLRDKEAMAERSQKLADSLAARLTTAEARAKELGKEADLVPDLRSDAKAMRARLTDADARILALEKDLLGVKQDLADYQKSGDESKSALIKELNEAKRSLSALESDRKRLTDEAGRLRQAAENRFAGIALTGKRVVFLVDMSGSMEMVDEKTPAPGKWTAVGEAVVKVMRSLPDLEKFQVILFAEDASFLIGKGKDWLDFDPKTSPTAVSDAIQKVKPRGNTNMFNGLKETFRFRASGLDTVYVFSDGLPNIGEGLSADASRNLRETEKGFALGNHIRKTIKNDWNKPQRGQSQVRINTIGFFFESPEVGAFLWALARDNDGSYVGMSKP